MPWIAGQALHWRGSRCIAKIAKIAVIAKIERRTCPACPGLPWGMPKDQKTIWPQVKRIEALSGFRAKGGAVPITMSSGSRISIGEAEGKLKSRAWRGADLSRPGCRQKPNVDSAIAGGGFMKNFTLLCSLIFLLLAECSQGAAQQQSSAQPNNHNTVYENQYMKVALLPGWTAKSARRAPAAVNIAKGSYILYINTEATQTSGVEGGRFAEIAMGAPSADAVVTVYPSPPCGKAESRPAPDPHIRIDLYVSKTDSKSQAWCNAPSQ